MRHDHEVKELGIRVIGQFIAAKVGDQLHGFVIVQEEGLYERPYD